ncbi:hypothetical protein [Escherichia coli]|uniref:hypothetical protein n=1 Tax=Escherichia coli TaxID=562 RepID=UPI0010AAB80A|nr:hypothetical protein [Escherichia coli]
MRKPENETLLIFGVNARLCPWRWIETTVKVNGRWAPSLFQAVVSRGRTVGTHRHKNTCCQSCTASSFREISTDVAVICDLMARTNSCSNDDGGGVEQRLGCQNA